MKQKSLSKFSLSCPVHWTELLEDKQYAKLGGVDTSQTYLLFETLFLLFWPHSCMIWTKLTGLTLFSAELPVWFSYVQEYGSLGVPKNFHKNRENPRTRRDPSLEDGPEGGHEAPRRPGGTACPLAAPGGHPGGPYLLWCPTLAPIYSPVEETPKQKSLSQSTSRSRRNPLFFPGELIWRLNWPPVRGKSSPSSSSSPLHHPSMTSPLMCE